MLVTNETPFAVFVHREHLNNSFALVDATVKTTFQRVADAWRFARDQEAVSTAPNERFPMSEAPFIRERGVLEVTVVGTVRAPEGRPFRTATATLTVGQHRRRIVAIGKRWWRRHRDAIEATEPEPTSGVQMSWQNAYGGRRIRPPGLVPNTNLPAPSSETACSANPLGKGWILDAAEADGVELPQLEDPELRIAAWTDRPVPRCWAAQPLDSSLRMQHIGIVGGKLANRHDSKAPLFARTMLNGPPELQFNAVGVGSSVGVDGFGGPAPLRFVVPSPPFVWRVTAGRRHRLDDSTLVGIHVEADVGRVALVWHARLYAPLVRGERRSVTLQGDRDALIAMAPA